MRDELQIDLTFENEKVKEIKFHCKCCAICKASASMLTEMVEEQSKDELKNISKDDVMENLGISLGPVRIKCALLPLKVLKAGIYGIDKWTEQEYVEEDEEEKKKMKKKWKITKE